MTGSNRSVFMQKMKLYNPNMSTNKTEYNKLKRLKILLAFAGLGKSALIAAKSIAKFGEKVKYLRCVRFKKRNKLSRFKAYRRKEKHGTELYNIR